MICLVTCHEGGLCFGAGSWRNGELFATGSCVWLHDLSECKVLCVIACSVSSLFRGHALDDLHVVGVGPSRGSCIQKKNRISVFIGLGVSVFIDFIHARGQCVH